MAFSAQPSPFLNLAAADAEEDDQEEPEEAQEDDVVHDFPPTQDQNVVAANLIAADMAIAGLAPPAAHAPPKSTLDRLLDYGFMVQGEVGAEILKQLLEQLHNQWIFPRQDYRPECYTSFGLDPAMAPNDDQVQQAYYKSLFQAFRVYMLFIANNMVGSDTDDTTEIRRTFSSIFETIVFTYEYLSAEQRIRIVAQKGGAAEALVPLDIQLFRFSFPDYSQNTEYQNLLVYLLQKLYSLGYRKYRGACYQQIKTPQGYASHAWHEECEIEQFVFQQVDRTTHYQQWRNLTKARGTPGEAAKFLARAYDTEFPELDPNRHFFSCQEGLYNAAAALFFPFDKAAIDPQVTAVNYFEVNVEPPNLFVARQDWYQIPTPDMQTIFLHQKLPEQAIRWMYALMGRVLYWVGECDSWQVIPFIKGVAGTGKSTIGRVVSSFYPAADVAILSSNIEKKFGLQNVYDKLLFVCYEVRNNFGLEQAEFQSIVSGEPMSIARKFMSTVDIRWKVPGLLLGNEVPNWVDVAGSVKRRTILCEYNEKVNAPDPQLHVKLFRSILALLHKCNIAYHEAVDRYGDCDIWSKLPAYFHDTARRLAASVNSLTSFIMLSDKLELNANKYVAFSEFSVLYQAYVRERHLTMVRLQGDNYDSIFQSLNITQEKGPRIWLGVMQDQNYLVGIGLRDGVAGSGGGGSHGNNGPPSARGNGNHNHHNGGGNGGGSSFVFRGGEE